MARGVGLAMESTGRQIVVVVVRACDTLVTKNIHERVTSVYPPDSSFHLPHSNHQASLAQLVRAQVS
jgi:hypothetical protein